MPSQRPFAEVVRSRAFLAADRDTQLRYLSRAYPKSFGAAPPEQQRALLQRFNPQLFTEREPSYPEEKGLQALQSMEYSAKNIAGGALETAATFARAGQGVFDELAHGPGEMPQAREGAEPVGWWALNPANWPALLDPQAQPLLGVRQGLTKAREIAHAFVPEASKPMLSALGTGAEYAAKGLEAGAQALSTSGDDRMAAVYSDLPWWGKLGSDVQRGAVGAAVFIKGLSLYHKGLETVAGGGKVGSILARSATLPTFEAAAARGRGDGEYEAFVHGAVLAGGLEGIGQIPSRAVGAILGAGLFGALPLRQALDFEGTPQEKAMMRSRAFAELIIGGYFGYQGGKSGIFRQRFEKARQALEQAGLDYEEQSKVLEAIDRLRPAPQIMREDAAHRLQVERPIVPIQDHTGRYPTIAEIEARAAAEQREATLAEQDQSQDLSGEADYRMPPEPGRGEEKPAPGEEQAPSPERSEAQKRLANQPRTTPGTRITWRGVGGWSDAMEQILGRKTSSIRYRQMDNHVAAFPLDALADATGEELQRARQILMDPSNHLRPSAGMRGTWPGTRAIEEINNQLSRNAAALAKAPTIEPAEPREPEPPLPGNTGLDDSLRDAQPEVPASAPLPEEGVPKPPPGGTLEQQAIAGAKPTERTFSYDLQKAGLVPEGSDLDLTPDVWSAETGRPFVDDVFHAEGREETGSVYHPEADGPALGPGRYYGMSEDEVRPFGDNINQERIALANPYVLETDQQLRELAGVNELPYEIPEWNRLLPRIRAKLEALGHDGVVVNVPQYGDFSRHGEARGVAKRLREVFSTSQVVVFNPEQRPAQEPAGPHAARIGAYEAGPRAYEGEAPVGTRQLSWGNENELSTPEGPIHTRWAFVELDDLLASGHVQGKRITRNPAYPPEFQTRDYESSQVAADQIAARAANLDENQLYRPSGSNDLGPPVVLAIRRAGGDYDFIVVGGNNRTMIFREIPQAELQDHARAWADAYGIDAQQAQRFEKPVPVQIMLDRRPQSADEARYLSDLLNRGQGRRLTDREKATGLATQFGDRSIDAITGALDEADENATLGSVLRNSRAIAEALRDDGVLTPDLVDTLVGPDGKLNPAGIRLVEEALMAKILPDRDLRAGLTGELAQKVTQAIPGMLRAMQDAPGFIQPLFEKAIATEVMRQRASGKKGEPPPLEIFLRDQDWERGAPPAVGDRYAESLLRFIVHTSKPTRIRQRFNEFARMISDSRQGQESFFGEPVVGDPEVAFRRVFEGGVASGRVDPEHMPEASAHDQELSRTGSDENLTDHDLYDRLWARGAGARLGPGRIYQQSIDVRLAPPDMPLPRRLLRRDVIDPFLSHFGVTIDYGRLRSIRSRFGPRELGYYLHPSGRIKTRDWLDLNTNFHELGHWLHLNRAEFLDVFDMPAEIDPEAYDDWLDLQSPLIRQAAELSYEKTWPQEGVAEAIRLWFLDAPRLDYLAPDVKQALDRLFGDREHFTKKDQKVIAKTQERGHKWFGTGLEEGGPTAERAYGDIIGPSGAHSWRIMNTWLDNLRAHYFDGFHGAALLELRTTGRLDDFGPWRKLRAARGLVDSMSNLQTDGYPVWNEQRQEITYEGDGLLQILTRGTAFKNTRIGNQTLMYLDARRAASLVVPNRGLVFRYHEGRTNEEAAKGVRRRKPVEWHRTLVQSIEDPMGAFGRVINRRVRGGVTIDPARLEATIHTQPDPERGDEWAPGEEPKLTAVEQVIDRPSGTWYPLEQASRARGGRTPLSPKMIEQGLAYADPNVVGEELARDRQKAFDELVDFNSHVADFAQSLGLISESQRELWPWADYALTHTKILEGPEMRPTGRLRRGIGSKPGTFRARGSTRNLEDPLSRIWAGPARLIQLAWENRARQEIFRLLERPGGGMFGEEIKQDSDTWRVKVQRVRDAIVQELKQAAKASGEDAVDVPDDFLREDWLPDYVNFFRQQAPHDSNVMTVYFKGKARYAQLSDPLLIESLAHLRSPALNRFTAVMNVLRRIKQASVVHHPDFWAGQLTRDPITNWVLSRYDKRYLLTMFEGYARAMRYVVTSKEPLVHEVFANMGGGSSLAENVFRPRRSLWAIDEGGIARQSLLGRTLGRLAPSRNVDYERRLLEIVRAGERNRPLPQRTMAAIRRRAMEPKVPQVISTAADMWKLVTRIGMWTEMGPRLGAAIRAKRAGKTGLAVASEYREASVDFSQRGNYAGDYGQLMGFLVNVTPFLGAQLASWDRVYRSMGPGRALEAMGAKGFRHSVADEHAKVRTAMKIVPMVAVSMALQAVNQTIKEYRDEDPLKKLFYWYIPIPTGQVGDDGQPQYDFALIPKPYDFGMVATIFDLAMEEMLHSEDPGTMGHGMQLLMLLDNNFGTGLPPLVEAGIQWYANRYTFTDRPIDTDSQKAFAEWMRVRTDTSKTSEWLAEMTRKWPGINKVSPAHQEAFMRALFGNWPALVMWMSDEIFFDPPEKAAEETPFTRRFWREGGVHTRYARDFYEYLDQARKARSSFREQGRRSQPELQQQYGSEQEGMMRRFASPLEKLAQVVRGKTRQIEQLRSGTNRAPLSAKGRRERIRQLLRERAEIMKSGVKMVEANR